MIAPEARRSSPFARRGAVGLAGVAVIAAVTFRMRSGQSSPSLAVMNLEPRETPLLASHLTEQEVAPPVPDVRDRYPVPDVDGTPLDEMYPSLIDWIHPVVGADLLLSTQQTGMFGEKREGVSRKECGGGHCGVDLVGPIGRPIVAVSDGVVVRIERSELGRDGRSGRYVRIEHEDGTLTAYMHLDTIEPGLQVGDRVDGGQQIGTLGATAVYSAAPHCHFSLEIPNIPGTHGDNANTHYVDPAPFLVRARVVPSADRRRPEKPVW